MRTKNMIMLLWPAIVATVFLAPARGHAQDAFATIRSVHFDVRYQQGVPEAEAQRISDYLLAQYDSIRNDLGTELQTKQEVRIYASAGKFRSEINVTGDALPAMYVRGILHVQPAPRKILDRILSFQLGMIFLEPAAQKGCPLWLRESYAVYHSGRMQDLSVPSSVTLSSFADLSQDIQEARTLSDQEDVEYVLAKTMVFLVKQYGRAKAFGVFKEFDGSSTVEKIFKKVFGQDYPEIEKAWAKYVNIKPGRTK